MELTWFVLLAVCTLLVISACIVGIAICVCRRYQAGADDQIRSKSGLSSIRIMKIYNRVRVDFTVNHTNHDSKGIQSKHQNAYTSHQTTTIPMSGNLHHPAGQLRYCRKTHELLMAKIRPILCPAC